MNERRPSSLAGNPGEDPGEVSGGAPGGWWLKSRWIRSVRTTRVLRRRWRRDAERGATTLEWLLLVAAIALPSYAIIRLGLELLFAHYRLMTTLNGLPFP